TGHPVIHMDVVSAELTKYAANSFLAMKISFMNEMSKLCEKVGANIDAIRTGIGSDPRIGRSFLFAGTGYGGSCFPKDVKAILRTAREFEVDLKLIENTEMVNETQKRVLYDKMIAHYGSEDLSGKTFAIWGLSFKPETDDMREAPAIVLIEALLAAGAKVRAYDPVAMENAKLIFGDRILYSRNEYDAVEGADALAVVTEWRDFRTPDFEMLAERLKEKLVFDGRNLYDRERLHSLGFKYYAIGKNPF
ncbi:nucleotide sugar dehydrogenase, partial [bacterium]|nr:nucleotide sugar dehydrogenase [bacterium]